MAIQLMPPSAADLWLRNLRMLDLDRLSDWPSKVTTQTFRDDDVRTRKGRARRAEWILYRLFELWDPRETQSSLAALFPALEPAQSIRLRSSMLAILSTLKQDGHLGTCALRKSLLDDCCGPRFDHLLLAFSTAVLKRIAVASTAHLGIDLQHATTENLVDVEILQQLALVYSSALHNRTQEKQLLRMRTEGLEAYIHINELTLQSLDESRQSSMKRLDEQFVEAELDGKRLKKRLRLAAGSDEAWMNLILSGEPARDRTSMPEDSFDSLWMRTQQGLDFQEHKATPTGVLTDIETRLGQRQEQLKKWRRFQTQISQRNEDLIVARTPAESPRKTPSASLRRSPTKAFKRMGSTKETPASGRMAKVPIEESVVSNAAAEKASGRLRDAVMTDGTTLQMFNPSPLKRSNSSRQPASDHPGVHDPPKERVLHRRSRSDLPKHTSPSENVSKEDQVFEDEMRRLANGVGDLRIGTTHQSLAERTRESLALTSRQPRHAQGPASAAADEMTLVESNDSPLAAKSDQAKLASLIERTSISLQGLESEAGPIPKAARRPTQRQRPTRKYSQLAHTAFEPEAEHGDATPALPCRVEGTRVVTPPATMFEEAIDAESVFKTRARVRRSPPPSEG